MTARAKVVGLEHWTVQRKAALLDAVRLGEITRADAQAQHNISDEEFEAWERRFARHGHQGLAAKKVQELRA